MIFIHKTPALLRSKKYHLNKFVSSPTLGFYWKGSFKFKEKINIDKNEVLKDLEVFTKKEKQKMGFPKRILNEILYYVPKWLLKLIYKM
jgi:hypothetical protein